MQTRTYSERSNARRAARAAGLDPDLNVIPTDDGFEVHFPVSPGAAIQNGIERQMAGREASPIKQAVEAAIERGIEPKEFVQIAEGVADELDPIPEFCKIPQEKRRESWIKNPPRVAAANRREAITMAKTKAKEKKARGATGADKTAALLKMLAGKGSTVEQLTKALGWLPHTLRARISRLPKEDKKIKIERERVDGVTSYRIAS